MDFITVPEFADIANIRETHAYTLVRTGVLPPGVVVRVGRLIRINNLRLREWMDQGGTIGDASGDQHSSMAIAQ